MKSAGVAIGWNENMDTLGGRYGSRGKSCRLAVGGLPVRSHPGWYLAWQPIAVGV